MDYSIVHNLALRLKLNKLDGCGIAAPILLYEYLKRVHKMTPELVQGYYTSDNEKCWHVWVRHNDTNYDIGHVLACLIDPEFKKVQYTLNNTDDIQEGPQELIDQFKLYQEKPSVFWKNTSRTLQNFRSKILYTTK